MERTTWPKTWLRTTPGRACPSCGARAGRPIIWGMPTGEVFEALDSGEIDVGIGGCVVSEDDPTHVCGSCGHEWGRRR